MQTYPPAPDEHCYACGRKLPRKPRSAYTSDGQHVYIGPDCRAHVANGGEQGWKPPVGGPRLFLADPTAA